jgi:hypothetical protein
MPKLYNTMKKTFFFPNRMNMLDVKENLYKAPMNLSHT